MAKTITVEVNQTALVEAFKRTRLPVNKYGGFVEGWKAAVRQQAESDQATSPDQNIRVIIVA